MKLELTLNHRPYTLCNLPQHSFTPSFINECWEEVLDYAKGSYLNFYKPCLGEAVITTGALFTTTTYHLTCHLKDPILPQEELSSWAFKLKLFKAGSEYHTLTPSFPVTKEGLTEALLFTKKVIQADLHLAQEITETGNLNYLKLFQEAQTPSDLTPILIELALAHSVKNTLRTREFDASLITAVLSVLPFK